MRFLRQWLPVVLWAALILSASNDSFSSEQSSGWAHRVFGSQVPEIFNILVRKGAHMTEYGVLAWLAWRARRTMGVPLLVALTVSSTDEFLQSRTLTRTGTVWDVVLDVCAAFLLLVFVESQSRKAAKPQRSSDDLPL